MQVLQFLEAKDQNGPLPSSTGQISDLTTVSEIIQANIDGAKASGLIIENVEWIRDPASGIAIRQNFVSADPFYDTPLHPMCGPAAPAVWAPIDAIGAGTLKVFAWGQSHSGNCGRGRYGSRNARAWAFTGGNSYRMLDPMPGPDGEDGCIWPRFADKAMGRPLNGTSVNRVIIDCCARGGSYINDWSNGSFTPLLISELTGFLAAIGQPTFLHFCQGAANTLDMLGEQWFEQFKIMLNVVRTTGCSSPILVDTATMCNMRDAANPSPNEALFRNAPTLIRYEIGRREIRKGQAMAASINVNTKPGANFDGIDWELRAYGDGCHMGEKGLDAHAQGIINAWWNTGVGT